MELSEAKEFWKNRAECFRIEIKNNKGKTPKDMLEKEKLEHAAQSIDTVLKALDNSISKDEVRNKMEKLNKLIKNAEPIEAVFMIKQQQALHELLLGEE